MCRAVIKKYILINQKVSVNKNQSDGFNYSSFLYKLKGNFISLVKILQIIYNESTIASNLNFLINYWYIWL